MKHLKFLLSIFFLILSLCSHSFAAEESSVTIKEKRGASSVASPDAKYHALIIGSNNYKYLPKLKTAISDAKAVENILKSQYGFETKLLIDAPRKDILSAINDFRKKLGSKDNLLIYYAGHGEFDKTADRAYWLPVEAQRDDPVDWISATDITDNIKRIASKHILIVSDSCYSGTLTRAAAGDLSTKGERNEYIKKMTERSSRTLMASGGNEPVADEGSGGHSVFASALLKSLEEFSQKNTFTAEELFHSRLKAMVAGKSEQVPEYNDIRNSGHEGGDFVFQLVSSKKEEPLSAEVSEEMKKLQEEKERLKKEKEDLEQKKASAEISEERKKLQKEEERLKREREELEQKKALMEEKKRLEEERQKLEKEKAEIAMAAPHKVGEAVTSKTYKDSSTGMELVYVKGGCYQMGDSFGDGRSNEKPIHEVCVDDFYIGQYEVTQKEWREVMGSNPSKFKGCDNCPVERVNWNDIKEFINKLNQKTGKKYRLPTEAEWEYAARSVGKNEKWAGTSNESELGDYAWYDKNSGSKTHPVGQKKPNGLGIYDMSGNVWEWVEDGYDENYYRNSPRTNPVGPSSSHYKVRRGGSWLDVPKLLRASYRSESSRRGGGSWDYLPEYLRASDSFRIEPEGRNSDYGFRLALSSSVQ
ncbi:MAG: SUMF1/EgtB/PvdO family nonheme iron enzyme [Deltaproteobacteria bacterium]|nr:SUMF1/EgtB/PvdO family nonheme iron enzyme [Deltaproteobacteria bacterium]